MKRDVSVEEISDGGKYRSGDLVKVGTDGCRGCCDCCRMDPVIVLDPWDVYMLQKGTGKKLAELLDQTVCLDVIDGLIQPVLKMADGVCLYLGADGRCKIHAFRPGICRLYPLGRSWETVSGTSAAVPREDFSYILQVHECTHCTGSKVKVKKWLGIPELPKYEDYCRAWHGFLKQAQELCAREENLRKIVCMQILEKCYLAGFDTGRDFYPQFEMQLRAASASCGIRRAD